MLLCGVLHTWIVERSLDCCRRRISWSRYLAFSAE